MTARIQKDFQFVSGMYYENEFYMNIYDIDINCTVESDSIQEQNIALDRIKYFIHVVLENAVFVHDVNTDIIEQLNDAGLKICVIPEEPYDQIIGIMLLVKLNAIAEGRLLIHDIQITSKMSDGVSCLHSIEENTGPFGNKGWWRENNLKIINKMIKSKKKIVKLTKSVNNWDELSLNWKDKKVTSDASEILYASFEKVDK